MRIRVFGKYFDLRFTKIKDRGYCHGNKIRILKSLEGEEKVEVLIHELLHAADPTKDEEWVSETAEDIARVLWRVHQSSPLF